MTLAQASSNTHFQVTDGLVSIVMPAFNADRFIAHAIDSVLAQTYRNWELLIVDDGSTDRTHSTCQRYAAQDDRIRVLSTNGRQGPGAARNTAITVANGEFIAFLDADDTWHPEKLSRQVALMRQSGSHLTATAYYAINDAGEHLGNIPVPHRLTYRDLLKGNRIGCLTAMYNQRTLGKVYMPADARHEDYLTWLGILRHGGYALGLNEPLAYYRKHENSVSASKLQAASWQWNIYRKNLRLNWAHSVWLFANYALRGVLKHRF